ncbi:hypothetical protein D3C75_980150 [compost metagenome]
MWVRIEGKQPDFQFYDPRELKKIPQMIPNEMYDPNSDEPLPQHIALTDEEGKPITRDAEFDLSISIGDGLPNDKAFIFDMIVDLAKMAVEGKPVIFWSELRDYLREEVGIPLKDEHDMQQEQQMLPGQDPNAMPPDMMQQGLPPQMPQGMPPQVMQQMMQAQQPPQNVIPMPQGGAPVANTL